MRTLLFWGIFLALAIFAAWQYRTISSLRAELAATGMHSQPRTAKAPAQAPAGQKIICPLCHGERVYVYASPQAHNPLQRVVQTCPVCRGLGYRIINLPAGYQLCPDCKGMGLANYPLQPGEPARADQCVRCGATGVVPLVK